MQTLGKRLVSKKEQFRLLSVSPLLVILQKTGEDDENHDRFGITA